MKNTLLCSFLITSIGLTAQVPSYVPQDSLVGWWGFNGNANDESGNGNDGTVNGATLTDDRFGNPNSAYDFDGANDFIEILNTENVQMTNGLTFSCWFNPNVLQGSALVDKMGGISASCSNGEGFWLNSRASGDLWASAGCYQFGIGNAVGTVNYPINDWSFVVGTINIDDTIRLYFNGNLFSVSAITGGTSILGTTRNIIFGKGTWSSTYAIFDGKLDDIGIWTRALDSCEIKDLYNANSSCTNGINELDNSSVNLYPNPTNGSVTLSFSNTTNGQVILTDLLGKEVLSKSFTSNEVQLNLKSLEAKGTYFAKVLDADSNVIAIKKLIYQ